MNITAWNVRGHNAPNKKRILKQNLNKFESYIILLQETKLNKIEGTNLGKKLGNWSCSMFESVRASGGLGFILNHRKILLEILTTKNNSLSGLVSSVKSIYMDLLVIQRKKQYGKKSVNIWEISRTFL